MNLFLKSSAPTASQLVDKTKGNVVRAQKEIANIPDPMIEQQERAEKIQENAVKQEEMVQKQEAEKQKLQERETADAARAEQDQANSKQLAATNLSRAANTPSYKNYTIQKQAGMVSNILSKVKWSPSATNVTGGVATGGMVDMASYKGGDSWSEYGNNIFSTSNPKSMLNDPLRIIGAAVSGYTGGKSTSMWRPMLKKKQVGKAALTAMVGNIGVPAAERMAMLQAFGKTPQAYRNMVSEGDLIQAQINEAKARTSAIKTPVIPAESDNTWKWLAGAGLTMATVPALAYAYKSLFNKDEDTPGKKSDRVALEIPSSKISDSFYNRMGREILFKDDKEALREEEEKAKKKKTKTKTKKAASVTNLIESTRSSPNSSLTYEQADANLSPLERDKWVRGQNTPKGGFWGAAEMLLPIFGSALGLPQMTTSSQRYAQHMIPLESKGVLPSVENAWTKTLAGRNPKVRWTPGKEITPLPA